jgi:hypothetical protein
MANADTLSGRGACSGIRCLPRECSTRVHPIDMADTAAYLAVVITTKAHASKR